MTALTYPAMQLPSALVPEVTTVRVLVVDDSVVMRQLISRMLHAEAGLEVVAVAKDGIEAVEKLDQFKPDLITLDVEMPQLDGIGALKLIKERRPSTRVIMCSSLTARGARITVEALTLGADDYVAKDCSGEMTQSAFDSVRSELIGKIRSLFPMCKGDLAQLTEGQAKQKITPSKSMTGRALRGRISPQVLIIGVSTGGPSALAELLPAFPSDFPLPILIVQHMPPVFTASLAERLTRLCRLPVFEASAGMAVEPGRILLAPGDFHLRLVRGQKGVVTTLDQSERENFCRPAVDVLLRSVAEIYSGAAILTVLTGMGQDGLKGARLLHQVGATVIVQDKNTSVVWGMPGAIAGAELADAVVPLKEIYPLIAGQL